MRCIVHVPEHPTGIFRMIFIYSVTIAAEAYMEIRFVICPLTYDKTWAKASFANYAPNQYHRAVGEGGETEVFNTDISV